MEGQVYNNFYDYELEELEAFFKRLYEQIIRKDMENKLVWLTSKSGIFSIKSFYSSLSNGRVEAFSFGSVWNSWTPSRINFFFFLHEKQHGIGILILDKLKNKGWRIPNGYYTCKE